MCTAVLETFQPSPSPRIWAHIRWRYWSSKVDDISRTSHNRNHDSVPCYQEHRNSNQCLYHDQKTVTYLKKLKRVLGQSGNTSGFWPRVRARKLRVPGLLTPQTGRCAPTAYRSFAAPSKKNVPETKIYLSTELSFNLMSFIAPY
jgi:hypothetical protein